MPNAPATVRAGSCSTRFHVLRVAVATVGCLTLSVGSPLSEPATQRQQSVPQKTAADDELKALREKA
jgi:hypothetical protein